MIVPPLMHLSPLLEEQKVNKKAYSSLTIDKRRGLTLLFDNKQNSIQFTSESIQEFIFNSTDIKEIQHFSYTNINCNVTQADHLLSEFGTFYNLLKVEDDELRYPESLIELKNGIRMSFDYNLSTITAKNNLSLFDFVSYIFDAYGYNSAECSELLNTNPEKIVRLFKRNNKIWISYKIV